MFKKRYTCLSLTTPRYFAKYDMMTTDAVEDRWKRSMRDKKYWEQTGAMQVDE